MRDAFRTSGKRSKNRRPDTQQIREKALRSALSRQLPFAPEPLENRTLLSTVVLTSTDDTYVRPSSPTGNFNQATGSCALPLAGTSCLVVRNDNGTSSGGLARITYLKFDGSALAGTVNSASLRLFGLVITGTDTFAGDKTDEVFGVGTTTWLETNLTYANRPLPDTGALSAQVITGTTLKPYTWDVMGWVPGHLGGPIAFMLQEANQSSLSHLYRPHEWTTDAERPKLILSIGAPDAPNGVTATAGNGQITLNWSNTELDGQAVDATSWSVYRGNTSGSEVLVASNITTNSYVDTTVVNGTDYFYYVVANNSSGDSPASSEVGPVRPVVTPAPAPTPIRVTEGVGTITLSWDAVPFADSYKVYRSDTSGGLFVLQPPPTGTSFIDNVAAGAKFYYKVSSVNSAGEGPLSPEIVATAGITGDGTGISGTYYDNIDFTGTQVVRVDGTINFDFDATGGSPDPSLGADTFSARWLGDVRAVYTQPYTFYTRTDDGVRLWINDVLVIDHWVDQGATTWPSAAINLVAGQKYHIRMDFYENGGAANAQLSWSSPSTPQEIVPTSQLYPYDGVLRMPATPANVTANPIDSSAVCVLWNDISYDEDNFILERATNTAFTDAVNVTLPQTPNVASCQDTSVVAGTTYYYRVASHNAVGTSPFAIANQRPLTGLSRTSNVTTVTTAAAHGLVVGSVVNISGVTPSTFNGTFTVTAIPTATTFTVANTGTNAAATVFTNYTVAAVPSGTPGPVNFNPFPASTNDLVLVDGGDPNTPPPSFTNGRLRLTDPINGAAGAAWTTNVKIIDSFTANFDFQITQSNGADGFTFTVQGAGPTVVGGAGGGLGFAGLAKSVGIKFDFYYGPSGTPGVSQTGVHTNGDASVFNDNRGNTVNTTADISLYGIDLDGAGTGVVYHVDVAYDGATLLYTITDTTDRTRTVSLHYNIDIASVVGSHCAWVGFTAANGGLHATQEILNFNFNSGVPVVNGTTAPDSFYVRLDNPGGNNVQVWKNHNPAVDPPDVNMPKASINNLALSGGGQTDTFTVDFSNGNPLPAGGLLIDGGMNDDTLIVKGTSSAESFSINGTQVTVPGGGTFRHTGLNFASFNLGANGAGDADDSLSVTGNLGFSPILNGGGGRNTLTLNNSAYTATADSLTGNNDGAGNSTLDVVTIGASPITSTSSQHLRSLALNGTSSLTLTPGGSKLLRTGPLTVGSGAALDVGDGDVIVQSSTANKQADWNALMNLLRTGRNGGRWNGAGIRSASAASNAAHATAVGIILNDNGSGGTILPTFNGEAVDANTVLLKYTYYGDRDFDGDVDADDYAGIDAGFANRNNPNPLAFPHQPWRDGDLNLSGAVNSDDYFAIDLAFSNQPTVLGAAAEPMAAAASTTVSKTASKHKAKHKHHKSPAPQRVVMFRVRD